MTVAVFLLRGNKYVKIAEIHGEEIVGDEDAKRMLLRSGIVNEEIALKRLGENPYLFAAKVKSDGEKNL